VLHLFKYVQFTRGSCEATDSSISILQDLHPGSHWSQVTVAGSAELIANPALQLTHFPPRHLSQLGVAEQSEGVTRQALLASIEYPNSHLKHLDFTPTVFWP
jgi:hypothetical protein